MASEFTELCDMYGLSPGDPEAIDKLIHFIGESDDEDDSWYFNENADAFDPDSLKTEETEDEEE
jgi:hypothetical protein|tara:strand:+ start:321 stop:512 length:192 start_codon:yes stop_codon:yes gene_type:complete